MPPGRAGEGAGCRRSQDTPWLRRALLAVLALLLAPLLIADGAPTPTPAPTAPSGASADPSVDELAKAVAALQLPSWMHDESVSLEAGWRANPVLSAYEAQGRGFGGARLEGFAWHLPGANHLEGGAMLDAEVRRYLDPLPGASGEQHWFLHGELRWTPLKALRLSVSPDLYYLEQVLDLSEAAAARYVAPVKVLGAKVQAVARLSAGAHWAAELGGGVGEARYRDVPEDNTEPRAFVRGIWTPSDAWTLEAEAVASRRSYRDRNETTAAGRPIAGTRLHFQGREGSLKATHKWMAFGQWTASLKGRYAANRDEHAGFFDFDLAGAAASVEWTRDKWTVSLDADASKARYLVQTVGAGIAPPRRFRDDYDVTLRVERTLGKTLTVFAEAERERSRTNLENASYSDLTAFAGLKRSF